MTILITGSSGKTSSRLAPLLPASHPPLIASRTGKPSKGGHATVRFDWLDSSTYELPFEHEQVKESPITGVYLVAPPVMDPQKYMNDFITFAKGKGVKRFVLLSSESIGAGGPLMGEVHQFLIDNVEEWCVLRPSWFMGTYIFSVAFQVYCQKKNRQPDERPPEKRNRRVSEPNNRANASQKTSQKPSTSSPSRTKARSTPPPPQAKYPSSRPQTSQP